MNPISSIPLLPAPAGPATATELFSPDSTWLGLAEEARRIGVDIDTTASSRFARYRDLLLAWNERVNLTAIRQPADIERKLFLDALGMIPAIEAELASTVQPLGRPVRLIDIGSGAGLPGLALKIALPNLDVTLVDATAKKVAFLNDVIAVLGLSAARAVHGRAEELGQNPRYRERFEIATARAVASLPVLLEFVVPFLDVGGHALLPKGLDIHGELKAGRRAARKLGAEIVSANRLPFGDTRLVIALKTTLTGKTYPRRTGIPARSPLGEGT